MRGPCQPGCWRWRCSRRARRCRAESPAAGPYVNFNFEQVELRLLVKLVGDMTGRRFVVDETVSGKVTVVTPQRIPVQDAYPLLVSIMESSGFTVIEKGGAHHVVRLADRTVTPAPVVTDGGTNAVGLITKLIRVSNVSVVEVRKLLEPLVRGGKAGRDFRLPAHQPPDHHRHRGEHPPDREDPGRAGQAGRLPHGRSHPAQIRLCG
jgi:hypothetical protein